MSSEVEIANAALTLLGESRISSLDDDVKAAREIKAMFTISRDALLAAYNWSFAKARASLLSDVAVPPFGFGIQYTLPSDCLRILLINEVYVGVDLTDYRGQPTEIYSIEGRKILTDLGAPLLLRYVTRVTDTTQFAAPFTKAFAGQLAEDTCEAITQSDSKRERAIQYKHKALSDAIRANAIELPPQKLADDEWLVSRL